MKLLFIWLLVSVATPRSVLAPKVESPILGLWFAADLHNSTIKVYQARDGLIYGKIVKSDNKDWIGEVILKKVRYDAKSNTWKGEVYSLTMFFTVGVELSLLSEAKLKIVGTRFFMSKTFYWKKV